MKEIPMNLNAPGIDDYLHAISPPRDEVLAEMEAYAKQHDFPIVGPLVGRMLQVLARATGARRVFEMGSGYGYSAIWFARGGGPKCQVVCTDGDEANGRLAANFLERAGVAQQIDFQVGLAQELVTHYPEGHFDIMYNDVDKYQYPEALEAALPRLRKGGLFITDNILWDGKVLEPADLKDDRDTQGILEYTRRIYADDSKLFSMVIPVRDGVSVSVKL